MRSVKTDVLVVGGGPVGCTAGRYAALGGAKTLIVEKRREIGSPVRCGEGITGDVFPEIGIEKEERWLRNSVEGARFFSPAGHAWTVTGQSISDEIGLVIDRDKFDKTLAALALVSGAKMMLRTHVEELVTKEGRTTGCVGMCMGDRIGIEAKIVIAADGFESVLANQAGIDTHLPRKDIESCFQYTLAGVKARADLCDFYLGNRIVPGGYVWVFPKSAFEVNVGLGLQLSRIERPGEVKERLDAFISGHPGLSGGSPISMVAGAVSVSMPVEPTIKPGFMVVGDAARMVDPLSGGGLANGLVAAKIAGEVAAKAVKKDDPGLDTLGEYERGWRARLEDKIYRNYMAKELLCRQRDEIMDKVIRTLGRTEMEEVGTDKILETVAEEHPDVIREIEQFLF